MCPLLENCGDRSWSSGHLVRSQVASSNDLWGNMLEASSVSFNGNGAGSAFGMHTSILLYKISATEPFITAG